jgi:hypothetical protein
MAANVASHVLGVANNRRHGGMVQEIEANIDGSGADSGGREFLRCRDYIDISKQRRRGAEEGTSACGGIQLSVVLASVEPYNVVCDA